MLFLYFVYMTVQGDRGIFAMWRVQGQIHAAEQKLAETKAARAALESRVQRMRPDSIDPDLLDEQTRMQLNMVKPEDVVVLTPVAPDAAHKNDMLQRSKK